MYGRAHREYNEAVLLRREFPSALETAGQFLHVLPGVQHYPEQHIDSLWIKGQPAGMPVFMAPVLSLAPASINHAGR